MPGPHLPSLSTIMTSAVPGSMVTCGWSPPAAKLSCPNRFSSNSKIRSSIRGKVIVTCGDAPLRMTVVLLKVETKSLEAIE